MVTPDSVKLALPIKLYPSSFIHQALYYLPRIAISLTKVWSFKFHFL